MSDWNTNTWISKERLAGMILTSRTGDPMPPELHGGTATKNLFRQAQTAWDLVDAWKEVTSERDQLLKTVANLQAEVAGLRQNVLIRAMEAGSDAVLEATSPRKKYAHQALAWGDALMGYDYGIAGSDLFDKDADECEENFRQALRAYALAAGFKPTD